MESSAAQPDHTPSTLQVKDPLEAIYALNIGDFVTDSFMSDELLNKISTRLADDPDKLKQQLDELIHIYSMDKTLGILGFKPEEGFIIYDSIAAGLSDMLQVDACHILQAAHKETGEEYLSLTGTSLSNEPPSRWSIGFPIQQEDLLSHIYLDGGAVILDQLKTRQDWHPVIGLEQEKTEVLLATPLREGRKPMGLLLFETYSAQNLPDEFIAFAKATSRLFVTSLRLQQIIGRAQYALNSDKTSLIELRSLRANITESIADLGIHQQEFAKALGASIDARHHFTRGHSHSVAKIAKLIAESMALNEKTVDLVYYAGLVGNLGKIHIPETVLSKTGALDKQEWEALRKHPNVGVNLLAQINFLSEVVPYIRYQKERWDGSGYPEGLQGMSIPLGSRILAVADAYYAMTQERPYRNQKKLTHEETLKELQAESSVKWDPLVVQALAKLLPDF